jgi:hypothetical protein
MTNKKQVTKGLLDIGACWAVSDTKYQGTSFNDVRPRWHIHPDCTYPHEANIMSFDTLRDLAGYIIIMKKIQKEDLDQEQAYALLQMYWQSLEVS